jgi:hypothetical protein
MKTNDHMAIGRTYSMLLFVVPVQTDHVKYRVFIQAGNFGAGETQTASRC